MRIFIGLVLVAISIYFFSWWGLLSFLVVLPFIGWKDRYKGLLPTNQTSGQTTDYNAAQGIANETTKSFMLMQNILVKTSKKVTTTPELLTMLNQLRDDLRTEKTDNDELSDKELLQTFVQQFSTTFPNWQGEYVILSDLINNNFL